MYNLLIAVPVALGIFLIVSGIRSRNYGTMLAGSCLVFATVVFFGLLGFWGEMLWFQALGYGSRFWNEVGAKVILALLGGLTGFLLLLLATLSVRRHTGPYRWAFPAVGALFGGWWLAHSWDRGLLFWYGSYVGASEPILYADLGFYLFTLPFLDRIYGLLLLLSLAGILVTLSPLLSIVKRREGRYNIVVNKGLEAEDVLAPLYSSVGMIAIILAFGLYLGLYHLLYSTWGAVSGPGWTDVHIRVPAYYFVCAVTLLAGVWWLLQGARSRKREPARIVRFFSSIAVVAVLWLVSLAIIPGLLQWLRVEPNEITFEKPYISHNIEFTREGFGLVNAEEREFPASENLTSEMVEENSSILSEVRLWDWRALDAVYKQFQEIRLYYEFVDVDVDRYSFGGRYRQVMVSARELELGNLPEQSQTFVNRQFKYTHGYGITLTPVSEFTPDGLPNLLIKDIPPQSEHEELQVLRPQIYYGQRTRSHAYVNTSEEEFDYPSGEENRYFRYDGAGGVQLNSFWRKLVYGWKFDGTRFLFSSYPSSESRILFRRHIRERVQALAPFLEIDSDPFIVLSEGRLYWLVDTYTTSSYFPYSEPYSPAEVIGFREGERSSAIHTATNRHLSKINYMRNSIKVIVDAFEGSVDFYLFDPDDPIAQTWQRAFPDLFRSKDEMPQGLRAHIRYPQDYLLTQGLVYAKYHMTDPEVFYNQEDLWVRATEKYYGYVQPVEPYYIMWQATTQDRAEFVLMLPFTPKNRQVLSGWIAGMCDGPNYGRFVAYKFPKEKRILGPQQIETKIDQDRFLSGQLSLWDQRGSRVIRGNVLAIPIEETIVYVEPIYLQAETAAYPELRLVAIMHGDSLSYAETFEEALAGLFVGRSAAPLLSEVSPSAVGESASLAQRANQAFEEYLRLQSQYRFDEAARQLESLRDYLRQLSQQSDQ